MTAPSPALLRLYEGPVRPDWIDFNGHMAESRYLFVFGEATDALLRAIGVDAGYVACGHSFFTVETHLFHHKEAKLGETVMTTTQLVAWDAKRLHLFHQLLSEAGDLLATGEHMLLHVDIAATKTCPIEQAVAARILKLAKAQSGLLRPAAAGQIGRRS